MAGNTVQIKFEAVSNFSNVINNVKQIQNALRSIKLPDKVGDRLEKNINGIVLSMEKLQQQSKRGFTKPSDVTAYEKELQKADTMLNKIVKDLGSLSGKDLLKLNIDTTQITNLKRQVSEVKKEMASGIKGAMLDPSNNLKGAFAGMDQILGKGSKTKAIYDSLVASINKGNFSNAEAQWEKLTQYMNRYNSQKLDTAQWKTMKTAMTAALSAGTAEAQRFLPILNKLDKEIQDAVNVEQGNIESTIRGAGDAAQSTATQFGTLRQKEDEAANGILSMNQQMSQLKSQANYFFSLQNMFQLLKRGIQDAFETVKNLDKAMTETAVVTDFNVGDMWKALPEYTKLANELGATTQGAYETMTLYYQQGLDKEQAFGLGEETMKMARIAGLDYAQTTDMMTAALRGFNMELDKTSAKRINDVYSQLAAKTASDTRELGEAMERTASIAHSANMSFESTTAFLANMIETTREAPENLGTAMKTIVARFQELKENPYEISEVEGEEVNYNRIDKALKTIGVDLVDNKDKFRDLDDVFMDISEKWDGLSQTQQRYIATIAAGSRQQSRFIAMVGNYQRVSELTEAANNAAGASNVQFAKTLDSMEAKLNKLKNAWDQFLMAIANNTILKGAVDLGTKIIGTINDIIKTISAATGPLEGVTKSVLSLGAAFMGLKLGGKLVNTALGGVANFIDPKGSGGFLSGLTGRKEASTQMQGQTISKPIVGSLDRIYSLLANWSQKTTAPDKNNERLGFKAYGDFGKDFRDMLSKGTNIGDVTSKLSGLDANQQKSLMASIPNLSKNLRSQFMNQFSTLDLGPNGQKALKTFWTGMMSDVKIGATTWEQALIAAFDPQKVGQVIGGKTGDSIVNAAAHIPELNEKVKTPFGNIDYSDTFELDEAQGNAIRKQYFAKLDKALKGQAPGTFGKGLDFPLPKLNKFEQFGSKVANGTAIAGQAVTSFGMIVDQVVPGAGSMFMQLGNTVSMVGSTIGSVIGKLPQIGAFLKGPLGIATLAISGIVAAIIALKVKHDKVIKDIRESGKKVVKNYKETTDQAEKNLTTLNEYKENYAKLISGVDENGYNISLGTQEYADYKKMVNDLITMNPKLIKGYNAEGLAIIDKNKALTETIKLQQQNQKEAVKEFTSAESLQKTLDRRNTLDRFKRNTGIGYNGAVATTTKYSTYGGGKGMPLREQKVVEYEAGNGIGTNNLRQKYYQEYIDKLMETAEDAGISDKVESMLSDYGIDRNNIDDAAIRILEQQGALIEQSENALLQAADVDSDKITAVSEALAKGAKESEKFKESYADSLQQLQMYGSQLPEFKDLDEQWQGAYTQSLDAIASRTDLSAQDMLDAAENLAVRMSDASANVEDALGTGVAEAQEQYLADLDAAAYTDSISDELSTLEDLYAEAEAKYQDHKTAENQIIAEMYKNELDSIRNFTTDSGALLEEQFNTFKGRIDSVNKLFETYQSRTESGDYYTGADNLSQIMEDINSDKNKAGKGSQSWWTGAEMLVGEENVQNNSRKALKSDLEDINEMLAEGQAGADKFMQHLYKKRGETLPEEIFGKPGVTISDFLKVDEKGLDFNLDDISSEQFDEIAKALDMSSDTLTAMLNKSRQFYDIDFTNQNGIREALLNSDSTIQGTKSTYNKEEGIDYKNIYTSEEAFEAEAKAQGVLPKELKSLKADLRKKGVKLMPSADSITNKDLKNYAKDWGITNNKGTTTSEELIASLSQIGYGKEDIRDLWENAEDSLITDADKIDFNEVYDSVQQGLENPEIKGIGDSTVGILNNTDAILMAMGVLSENAKNNADNIYSETVGNKGTDTDIQAFGQGYTKEGQVVNDFDTFKQNREVLMTQAQDIVNQIQQYREGREQAVDKYGEDSKEVKDWDAAINKLETSLQVYQKNINAGDNRFFSMIEALKLKDTSPDRAQSQSRELSDYYKKAYTDQNGNLDLGALQQQGMNFASVNQDMLKNLSSDQLTRVLQQWKLTKTQIDAIRTELGTKWNQQGLESTAKKLTEIENKNKKIFSKKQKQIRYDIITNTGSGAVGSKGSDKAAALIQEATKGKTTIQKKIIYQAIVKQANGDKKGAQELINENFKGKEGKQVQKDINIITNPKIANKKELKRGLQTEVDNTIKSAGLKGKKKKDFNISVGVKKIKTGKLKGFTNLYDKVKNYKDTRLSISANTKDAKGDLDKIIDRQDKIADKKRQKITVTAGGDGSSKLSTIISQLKTIQGTYTATVTVKRKNGGGGGGNNKDRDGGSDWLGSNNIVKTSPIPALPSYAKGKVGPKGQGGLTLTGEKGYEVAWLPSQNKSMILGTKGPQMVNLPKNATVWNHEQSKKIIKQKSVPLGSLAGGLSVHGSDTWNSAAMKLFFNQVADNVAVTSGKTIKTGTKVKTKKSNGGSGSTVTKEIKKTGKISVKIYNIEKKIEATQQQIDLLQEKINKQLEKTTITLKSLKKNINPQIKYYTRLVKLNQQLYASAKKRLKALDKSAKASKTEIKWSNKGKKIKTDSKGKKTTTKTTVSHTANINLSKYIRRDPVTGAYQINQAALDNVSKKDKNKAKAIRDAAKKEIDENTSKMNSAQKGVSDANRAIEDIGQKLYETFYAWENELTKVLKITDKIAQTEARRAELESAKGLQEAMLGSGLQKANSGFLKQTLTIFKGQAANAVKKIKQRNQLIQAERKEMDDLLSGKKSKDEFKAANKRYKKANKASQDLRKVQAKKDEQKQLKIIKSSKTSKAEKKAARKKLKQDRKILGSDRNKSLKSLRKQANKTRKNRVSSTRMLGLKTWRDQAKEQRDAEKRARRYIKTTRLGDGTVSLDYATTKNGANKLEADKKSGKITEKQYELIKKFYDEVKEHNENIQQSYQDQLEEMESAYSLLSDLQGQYADRGEELLDAVENDAEQNIEQLEKLNDSLTNALKDLLDEVKKRLDQRRQQEENLKTEQDIASKQQRLAALRADSSGGNAKEIRQLEKELAEAQKSYERSLEDQALERLQDQADEAEKQREKQIKLLQNQLDVNKTNGELIAMVNQLLLNPEANESQIQEMWRRANDYYNKISPRKAQLDTEWNQFWADIQPDTGLPEKIKSQTGYIKEIEQEVKAILRTMERNAAVAIGGQNSKATVKAAQDAISRGATIKQLKAAGYTLNEIARAKGWMDDKRHWNKSGIQAARKAGYTASQLRQQGATATQLKAAGVSDKAILNAGYSPGALVRAGYSGAQAQRASGASGASVYNAVMQGIKDKDPDVSRSDLAGVSRTVDTNGKNKGGKTTGHYNSSGNWLVAAKKDSLYYYKPDQPNKVDHKIPLSSKYFTESVVKKNKIEAKQAILWALRNKWPGTFLNKKFGKLIRAAKLKGKTVKLKNGITGSINGSNGAIHWNDGTEGVQVWHPNTNKKPEFISFSKKTKSRFYRNRQVKDIKREYNQVNEARKKKKLSHYKTGGLATTTGPAWLDGTKSKPELVLNAQDTSNFLALKDVLAKAVSGSKSINNTDNANYDIDIHVDQLANDYDVDKMVERVKKQITKDAGYRNVNAVRHMR